MEEPETIEQSSPRRGVAGLVVVVAIVAATFACVATLAIVVVAGQLTESATPDQRSRTENRADTPERYADLAELLATPLTRVGQVPERLSLAEQQVAYEERVRALARSAETCDELAVFARREIVVVGGYAKLAEDRPELGQLAVGLACTALGLFTQSRDLIANGGEDAIRGTADVVGFFSRVKELQVASQANALRLASSASKNFAGPQSAAPLLAAKFVPPAGLFSSRTNTGDIVVLQSLAKSTLHDCMVVVRLKNDAGETFSNVHFVREWAPGLRLTTEYDTGAVFGTSVDDVSSLTVRMWSRELTSPALELRRGPFGW